MTSSGQTLSSVAPPDSTHRYFAPALALYAAISLSRLNEVLPFLSRLYLGKLGAVVLILAAAADLRGREVTLALKSTTVRCVGVITLLALLSVPGSYWPRQSAMFFQDQWAQTLLLFFCVVVGFANRRTAYATIVAVTATGAIGALEMVLGKGLSTGGRAFFGADNSITYDPNAAAALFVTLLPYAIFLATRRGKLRYAAMAMIPLFIAALIRTSSRGGTIALGVLAVSLIVFAPKRRRIVYAGVLGVIVITALLVPHSGLIQRFNDLSDSQDYNFTSRDGRVEIWKRGIGMMLTHPAFGVGVRAFEVANGTIAHSWLNAHNAVVQIGAELGLGGLIAFLVAVLVALRSALAVIRRTRPAPGRGSDPTMDFEHGLATAATCSLIAELSAAMFLSMAYDTMTLFVLAVPTALAAVAVRVPRATGAGVPALTIAARQPGWRSARRVATALPRPTPTPRPQV